MQRAYHLLKKFRFTVFCVLLIWYLCLFRPPRIHTFDNIAFFDKWVHMSMYLGTCSVFLGRIPSQSLSLEQGAFVPIGHYLSHCDEWGNRVGTGISYHLSFGRLG